jgi:hypothetical protein
LPSEKPARRLEDIIDNAQAIQRYIAGMDLDAFEKDSKTYDAVERCLERISGAAAKLGNIKGHHPIGRAQRAVLESQVQLKELPFTINPLAICPKPA